jgi:hypothetical protein
MIMQKKILKFIETSGLLIGALIAYEPRIGFSKTGNELIADLNALAKDLGFCKEGVEEAQE